LTRPKSQSKIPAYGYDVPAAELASYPNEIINPQMKSYLTTAEMAPPLLNWHSGGHTLTIRPQFNFFYFYFYDSNGGIA
jgi:hypothetical protein